MEIAESKEAGFIILAPVGRVDTKESRQLESRLEELLEAGERRFVIDMTRIERIHSTGIRALLMVARKLRTADGHLALCAVNAAVREVLDVAKLTSTFAIARSRQEAILAAPKPPKVASLEELATRLLGANPRREAAPPVSAEVAKNAARAAAILGGIPSSAPPEPPAEEA